MCHKSCFCIKFGEEHTFFVCSLFATTFSITNGTFFKTLRPFLASFIMATMLDASRRLVSYFFSMFSVYNHNLHLKHMIIGLNYNAIFVFLQIWTPCLQSIFFQSCQAHRGSQTSKKFKELFLNSLFSGSVAKPF